MSKRGIALTQIFILISSVIAFSIILNMGLAKAEPSLRPDGRWACDDGSTQISANLCNQNPVPTGLSSLPYPASLAGKKIGEATIPVTTLTKPFQYDGYEYTSIGKEGSNFVVTADGVKKIIPQEDLVKAGILDGKGEFVKDAVVSTTPKSESYLGNFFGIDKGTYTDAIVSGAQWAAVVGLGAYVLGSFIGLEEGQTNALSLSASMGALTGKSLNTLFSKGGEWSEWFGESKLGMNPGQFSVAAGVGVATLIFLATYKSEDTETKTFTCDPWQAPVGGSNCEKCNKGNLPCSEYQCRSLGQSCQLLNPGTDEENCAGVWEMERELERELEKEGISVWFEEINLDENKEISDFIYATEYENKTEYMKCQVTDEYDDYFKDAPPGVYLIFNDEGS